jgi:hypothetical protein
VSRARTSAAENVARPVRGIAAAALCAIAAACTGASDWGASGASWPGSPEAREALCRERWPALETGARAAFAAAADDEALAGRSVAESAAISLCLADRRPVLVERLTDACSGAAPATARASQLIETHLRACAATSFVAVDDAGRTETTLVDAPGVVAARRCREAPLLRAPAPELEALQAERAELVEEEADLRAVWERLSTGDRYPGASAPAYEPGPRWGRGDDRARTAAYERLQDLPLVIDAFTARCLWPAEDAADGDDPEARRMRAVEREQWRSRRSRESSYLGLPW